MNDVFISAIDLETVRKILSKFPESYFFGSRVTGKHKKFSDLDVCILSPSPLPGHVLDALRESFEQSNLPFVVDLSEFENLPDFLKEKIHKQKVKLADARAVLEG